MKWSGVVSALVLASLSVLSAADATSAIDLAQRNGPFAPSASQRPEVKPSARAEALQEKRVEKTTIDKTPAAVGDRRAPLDVVGTRDRTIVEKDSRQPEAVERPTSDFNHRAAAITTGANSKKPPLVAKYQDSMTAASAVTTAPFAALSGTSRAKINRFVFRKNGATSSGADPNAPARALDGAPVTPAAGGSTIRK